MLSDLCFKRYVPNGSSLMLVHNREVLRPDTRPEVLYPDARPALYLQLAFYVQDLLLAGSVAGFKILSTFYGWWIGRNGECRFIRKWVIIKDDLHNYVIRKASGLSMPEPMLINIKYLVSLLLFVLIIA